MKPKVRHAKGSRASHPVGLDPETLLERINALDLSPVSGELVRKDVFYPRHVNGAIVEYRKFLYLQGIHLRQDGEGCANFVPPDEISEVWHAHILMTRKYAADCETVFGRFLHHGYNPSPGTEAYREGIDRFVALYGSTFGETPSRFTFTCDPLRKDRFAALHRRGLEAGPRSKWRSTHER